MRPRPVNAKHGREHAPDRLDGQAGDPHPLLARPIARLDRDGGGTHPERTGENAHQLAIRRAVDGPCGNPDAQRVAVQPGDPRSRPAWIDVHPQLDAARGRP